MSEIHSLFFDVTPNSTLVALQSYGTGFAEWQRGVNFWIGDLARYAAARWPETWHQVFPEWISPGLVDRCRAVAEAYPKESDRNPDASWTIHMREANRPDRIKRVQAHVDAGRTSDEAAASNRQERANDSRPRWLLAIDVHYFLHRWWFSGAGVEAAVGVATWVQRTVERLRDKGLTDVVCCFDSPSSKRKELTASWEDRYKDRPPKDPELVQQLKLVRELLHGHGFCCVSIDGWESDDVMATYAAQFPGHVTLLSQDKDVRQCLSEKTNILLDVEWTEDEAGEMIPDYKWLTAKQHTETTGLRPDQWTDYQCIMGDTVDGIKGAAGIGEKGAADLIKEFGTVEGAIAAAKADDERIKPAKRKALIEFEKKLDVTRQLVTLCTELPIPLGTSRI